MDKITEKLKALPRVLDDNGQAALPPSSKTIENSSKFIFSVPTYYRKILSIDSGITASQHNTIVFDWYYRKSFVSVEVGESSISFYATLPNGSMPSGALDLSEKAIDPIKKHLNTIYGRLD